MDDCTYSTTYPLVLFKKFRKRFYMYTRLWSYEKHHTRQWFLELVVINTAIGGQIHVAVIDTCMY